MRTDSVLQVSRNIMNSSRMLDESIVALEGGATVHNSTFVFLLQVAWLTLPQLQEADFLSFLVFDAGAGGSPRAPGTQVVGRGQMFPQFGLI